MTVGFSSRPAETRLTERALDLLALGPANAVVLIEHVCQMPGAPRVVAEAMALALFAQRSEFTRDDAGQWWLASQRMPVPADPEIRAVHEALPRADELGLLSYVVVDVETTGTRAWNGDRVTEIAAIVVRDGAIVDSFETLVNPERPIPPWISSLTNITWDMVRNAPRFRDVCERLLDVMEGHVFVAHNAEFDWRFLCAEVHRASGRQLMGRRLCTVKLARKFLPQLRSRKLDFVANYYGINITARHRAGGDATATAHVLMRLLDEARSRECRCWDDLQRMLTTPRVGKRRGRRAPAMPQPVDKDTTA